MCVVPETTEPQPPAWPESVDDMRVAAALGTSVARVRPMVRNGELPRPLVDERRVDRLRRRYTLMLKTLAATAGAWAPLDLPPESSSQGRSGPRASRPSPSIPPGNPLRRHG